jgi:choline kinase
MNAVILAAGKGRRLGSVAAGKPKCLVKVGDDTILAHQLKALRECGVEKAWVVVGFGSEEVIAEARGILGYRVGFVHNPLYEVTNTSYSLWLALGKVTGNFLYLNGDVVFSHEVLRRLLESPHPSAIALEVKQCGSEEVKAELAGEQVVRISKEVPPARAAGEFIGIAKFDRQLAEALTTSLDYVVNGTEDRMAYFEKGLELILQSHYVGAVDVSDLPMVEIDFPEDLEYAREVVLPRIQRSELVGV